MLIHRDIRNLPPFNNAVITIGTFDGVHNGHSQIIQQLRKEAEHIQGESVIITFHPHPRMVVQGKGPENGQPVWLLNTLEEKIELLASRGIDHLVIVPFTDAFSHISAEEYIADFLVKNFHPRVIITGYDHKFGKGRKGDYKLLESFQDQFGFFVKEIPAQVLHNITISSTKIRNAIIEGDIATANECLGYDYFFTGTVIHGNKIGRTLGYPTANICIENRDKLLPAYGVYAVTAAIQKQETPEDAFFEPGELLHGMMNIGIRPTIGDNQVMTEINLFDFDKNIYDRTMRVFVKQYMREELKFANLDDLKQQISRDEINARRILKDFRD